MTVPEPTTGAAAGAFCPRCASSWRTSANRCGACGADFLAAAVPSPETAPTEGLRKTLLAALMAEYGADEETWTAMRSLSRVVTKVERVVAARVRAEADADRAAVERVRALHFRRPWRATDGVLFGQTEFPDRCDHCLVGATWPCSTIRALDGADTPATDAQDGAGEAHATRE